MKNMPRRRVEESGFTLAEVLIAITIMGILFVAVFAGLAVFLKSTVVQRSTAELDKTTRSYAEALVSVPYKPCVADNIPGIPGGYVGSGAGQVPEPAGYRVGVTVKSWNGSPSGASGPSGPSFVVYSSCSPENGVQQLTITVVRNINDAQNRQSQRLVMAKRNTT